MGKKAGRKRSKQNPERQREGHGRGLAGAVAEEGMKDQPEFGSWSVSVIAEDRRRLAYVNSVSMQELIKAGPRLFDEESLRAASSD